MEESEKKTNTLEDKPDLSQETLLSAFSFDGDTNIEDPQLDVEKIESLKNEKPDNENDTSETDGDDESKENKTDLENKESDETLEGDQENGDGEKQLSVNQLLSKVSGYEITDELESTPEGIVKGAEILATKMFDDKMNNFLSSNEDIKNFVNYLNDGGDPVKYIHSVAPEIDYTTLDTTDESNQKLLITNNLKDQGFDKDEISDYLKTFIDSNTIEKQAIIAQRVLSKQQDLNKQSLVKEQEDARLESEAQAEAQWKEINTVLEKDTLSGLPLTKKEKDGFKNFLTGSNKKGESIRTAKYNSLTTEDKLAIDLIIYQGLGNFNKLISKSAETKVTDTFKNILNKSKGNSGNNGKVKKPESSKPNLDRKHFVIG